MRECVPSPMLGALMSSLTRERVRRKRDRDCIGVSEWVYAFWVHNLCDLYEFIQCKMNCFALCFALWRDRQREREREVY